MSASLKRTPLAEEHIAAGARMVDFGGWDMPLAYGSQIEEHHAVRQDAGMFDVSHMLNVDVTGPDAFAFLQRLVANDVAKLTVPGKALYSCMLNPQGGVIDDLIIYFFAADEWRVVVNAGTADKDVAWMQRVKQAGAFDVTIAPRRDLAMVAVQGPNARAKVWAARPAWQAASEPLTPFVAARVGDDTLVARTGYTGEDGFEIVLPAAEVVQLWRDLIAQGVRPAGLGARDTLRLEAGMNLYGQDMDEETSPYEAALAWTVSLDEGRDFIGRDVLEAQKSAGTARQMIGLVMDEKGVLRHGQTVTTASGQGEILSGTFSPTLAKGIAFARVPAGELGEVTVDIRGRQVPVRVVKFPFVREGQAQPGVLADA